MISFKFGVLAFIAIFSVHAFAKDYNTYPQKPKSTPTDNSKLNPGYFVPISPESHKWVVSAEVNGKKVGEGAVPAYYMDREGRFSFVGTVTEGTEVKLEAFKGVNHILYWSFPAELATLKSSEKQVKQNQLQQTKEFWVSGIYLKPH